MNDSNGLIKIQEKTSWAEALENENWVSPLVNIIENDEGFTIYVFLPNVEREGIKIKLESDALVLMAKSSAENKKEKYLLQEIEVGNFYRRFNLSDSIDREKIEASYEQNQLAIKLRKKENFKSRIIKIN